MTKEYDLVILGGGTGGYTAAVRASQLGLTVAVVENDKLGGTCLHRGCIPSKALLKSAEKFRELKEATDFGVQATEVTFDFNQAQKRKETVVQSLFTGVQGLMKKHHIDVFQGFGRILGPSIFSPMPGTISIDHGEESENTMIVPKYVLIATGSRPRELPDMACDGEYVLHTDQALHLEELPDSLTIVGGGVIGIEWASMMVDLGVDVTVLEFQEEILPTEDKEVIKEVKKQLTKRGATIVTGAKIMPETRKIENNQISVQYEKDGEIVTLISDIILTSIGREANIDDIGLANTKAETDSGFLVTNDVHQTKENHIYAIGDCIGGMQLAHVASKEGETAVEHMANADPEPWEDVQVPSCIYSYPEIAHVGLTEEEAKREGYELQIGKMSFQANGKAFVEGDTTGFVKVITNKQTSDILGVHIVGPKATELISEAGLAAFLDASGWEIGETIHAHPTLSETMKEAALAVKELNIHG
ncbi:MAG TPA: dihydrolipoyl dehydrogenase [Pseudogracilibacillus sp.]|nr:dihydrolipoyl dehydrogenase [Pseudogracilibacillus sp.]